MKTMISRRPGDRYGFSLIEITIATLIMGLSVSGLLTLLNYGQLRYGAIDSGWRQRQELTRIHRFFRDAISRGENAGSIVVPHTVGRSGGVRLATWSTSLFPPDALFVQARFFDDRNKNGREETSERMPPQVWVFRVRNER